jgi:gamma-glutamyltranspeptidase/glutathione hydrolase
MASDQIPHVGPVSAVTSANGAVTCGHSLAAAAGADILARGGNAFDAFAAMSWALTVVEPTMSGLLGLTTVLTRTSQGNIRWLDGVLPPPSGLTSAALGRARSAHLSGAEALIPTLIASNAKLLSELGSISLTESLVAAQKLAADGFEVNSTTRYWFDMAAAQGPSALPSGYRSENTPVGAWLKQPDMARALAALAQEGPEAFANGSWANAVTQVVKENGGVLSQGDFNTAEPDFREVTTLSVGDWSLMAPSWPNCSFETLEIVALLAALGQGQRSTSPAFAKTLVAATRAAAQDRIFAWSGSAASVADLLSPERIARRAAECQDASLKPVDISWTPKVAGHTSHLAAVDAAGNLVCATQTLGGQFGSQLWADGLPLNGLGLYLYSADPAAPASVRPVPGVPPASILEMLFAEKDGRIVSMGSPGGFVIPTATAQGALGLLAGADLAAIVSDPRLSVDNGLAVLAESRVPADVAAGLAQAGYEVQATSPWSWKMGSLHTVAWQADSSTQAAADPRRGGKALAG